MLVCCKSLKFAFNWVLRHWELEKIHKTNKDPPVLVLYLSCKRCWPSYAATTPVVFTWWKLLKTRQQIWKCILPLSVSVRNHSRPVIKSHWSVTDILPTQKSKAHDPEIVCAWRSLSNRGHVFTGKWNARFSEVTFVFPELYLPGCIMHSSSKPV